MKVFPSQKIFFSAALALLGVAAWLAFDGFIADAKVASAHWPQGLNAHENHFTQHSKLDTTDFFTDSYMELCSHETSVEEGCEVAVLSKTVVKVQNDRGEYEDIEEEAIKKLPANSSINLMIEKYTVKKKMEATGTEFYVTVESFSTDTDHLTQSFLQSEPACEPSASLTDQQLKLIRSQIKQNSIVPAQRDLLKYRPS